MDFNPNLSLGSYLPEEVHQYFKYEARYLLERLNVERLVVVLAPAPRQMHPGHMIRVVENENPIWYRELVESHKNFRRDLSIGALERITLGKDKDYESGKEVMQDYIRVKKRGKLRGLKYKERKLKIQHKNYYDRIYRELIFTRLVEGDENLMYFTEPVNEVKRLFGLELISEMELGF